MIMKKIYAIIAISAILCSCRESLVTPPPQQLMTDDEIALETLAGGELGTTMNVSASAYEDPTPAVEIAGMSDEFMYGEYFFERNFTQNTSPFKGLGPVYVRSSCMDCHPGYGYGTRTTKYQANEYGNGYLLVVYDKLTDQYVSSVAGMPQTKATGPFKAPIDEDMIVIDWSGRHIDDWGNKFPDGETYELEYPEVTIPLAAFYGGKVLALRDGVTVELGEGEYGVKLESTIGIYGTGLLDAISDEDLKAQYKAEEEAGAALNPAIFQNGEWTSLYTNALNKEDPRGVPKKFTYALTRGAIQDGPGANAIWNITNVTRSDRRYHYLNLRGDYYAATSADDPEVQAMFYNYFPPEKFEEMTGVAYTGDVRTDIYNYLTSTNLPAEMSDNDYADFLIWHRGLAVPAARELDNPQVQRGRQLFREIGCTACHRPSWTTDADDDAYDPNGFFQNGKRMVDGKLKQLPKYPSQVIWPYTDMIQHRLCMVNDIRTGWCRTTPLWGRGLSQLCAGHSYRLHDRRAKTVIEAIMWHGSKDSDARWTVEKFRELSKEDRDAVVAFIDAI